MSTTQTAPRTAAEINARLTEIGATLGHCMLPDLLPNYRELNAEREALKVELHEAYTRESREAADAARAAEREAFPGGAEEYDHLADNAQARIAAIEKKLAPALAELAAFEAWREKHGGAAVDRVIPGDYMPRLQRLRMLRALLGWNG